MSAGATAPVINKPSDHGSGWPGGHVRRENPPDLEQPQIRRTLPHVAPRRRQQSRQQRAAQDRAVFS